ncbi:hypothetical protein [Paraburkholderia strydomiana]|jgi:hypothetical protein
MVTVSITPSKSNGMYAGASLPHACHVVLGTWFAKKTDNAVCVDIKGEQYMRRTFLLAIFAVSCATLAGTAQAEGCAKGAAAGGVAGHMAGKHGAAGAGAGCAIGHHEAAKKEKTAAKAKGGSEPAAQ